MSNVLAPFNERLIKVVGNIRTELGLLQDDIDDLEIELKETEDAYTNVVESYEELYKQHTQLIEEYDALLEDQAGVVADYEAELSLKEGELEDALAKVAELEAYIAGLPVDADTTAVIAENVALKAQVVELESFKAETLAEVAKLAVSVDELEGLVAPIEEDLVEVPVEAPVEAPVVEEAPIEEVPAVEEEVVAPVEAPVVVDEVVAPVEAPSLAVITEIIDSGILLPEASVEGVPSPNAEDTLPGEVAVEVEAPAANTLF